MAHRERERGNVRYAERLAIKAAEYLDRADAAEKSRTQRVPLVRSETPSSGYGCTSRIDAARTRQGVRFVFTVPQGDWYYRVEVDYPNNDRDDKLPVGRETPGTALFCGAGSWATLRHSPIESLIEIPGGRHGERSDAQQ